MLIFIIYTYKEREKHTEWYVCIRQSNKVLANTELVLLRKYMPYFMYTFIASYLKLKLIIIYVYK